MTRYITTLFGLIILLGTGSAGLAAEDIRTCSLARAYQCLSDEGCAELSIDEMALPRFVRIDLNSKTITSLDKAVPRTSKIKTTDRLEGMIVMQGTELRGWSIAVGEDSSDITLSVSGDGEGFIVFGSCISKTD